MLWQNCYNATLSLSHKLTDNLKLNANVVSVENAFYPKMVIGINSRSEHVEIAKDFLRFALSEELQSVDTYEGFPVNAKALETQAAADRSMAEAYDIDGSTAEFAIKAYSEETAKQLMDLCKTATLCLKEDTQIETSLTESLQAYLNGQASVEEAMDAVEGSLKMYLAE
jgi:ABC-type glycerol-3-phosphate transport system substrate-binding protein